MVWVPWEWEKRNKNSTKMFQHSIISWQSCSLNNIKSRYVSCEVQPARLNHKPTNRTSNEPARPGPKWPKIPILDQIWSFWGKKIPIFTCESKSFGTHITEKHLGTLFALFFWSGMGRNGPKMPIFGPKKPKTHILDLIWPFWDKNS